MRRADILALPYREIEQSGVLYTGLAFGKPMVLGDVGGFAEFGRAYDAARLVPPGDADGAGGGAERPGRRSGRARRSSSAAARAAVEQALRLGRDRRKHARALRAARAPGPAPAADNRSPMAMAKKIFWGSVAGLVHTHVTYPLTLAALERLRGPRPQPAPAARPAERPTVSLIIAAFDEEDVIAAKVADALALDYPRELLELIVASDGSSDGTVELARAAGADMVLDLPRGGKMATQNAAVERAGGEIVAFSDANSSWEPGRPRRPRRRLRRPRGRLRLRARPLHRPRGRQRGGRLLALRDARSASSSRASAGSPPATAASTRSRRAAYRFLAPSRSHDLSFPFELRKAGWRSVDVPAARADEKMVPTIEGEFARKRRMMVGLPDIVRRRPDVGSRAATARSTPTRSSPTGCSATRARSSTSRCSSPTCCCCGRAASTGSPSPSSSASWPPPRSATPRRGRSRS